jgi:hypothetical protein
MRRVMGQGASLTGAVTMALAMGVLAGCDHADCHDDETCESTGGGAASGGAGGVGGAGDDPASIYCFCLLDGCHDPFHAEFGEADQAAIDSCISTAAGLPTAGMDVDAGNFLECRQHFCDEARLNNPAACEAALGADPCQ